jgi:hypothetical protein
LVERGAARWRRICAAADNGKQTPRRHTRPIIPAPAVIRRRPRGLLVSGALLAVLGVLLVTALVDGGARGEPGPRPRALAPAMPHPGIGPRVRYAGPHGSLAGPVLLRARARSAGARIVAVTFRLDGRPLGTATTPPYTLDVDAGRLPHGRHRLAVEAVDRLGRRSSTRPVHVTIGGAPTGTLVRGPGPAFDAALAALARGGATVRLGPGVYTVGELRLGSGSRLIGSGRRTVLAAAGHPWALVLVRGHGVRVEDLALEGAGRTGRAVAVAGGSSDVRLRRLAIAGVRENGIEAWDAHAEVSVQDSVISGAGASGAGVFDVGSDRSRDSSVVRTRIYGFRGFGIDFVQTRYGRPWAAARALALDNRIADIQNPATATGTSEGGIWSGGGAAAIIGNRITDTGWDGIETVGSSLGVSIVDNDIERTRVGIYLEHETNRSLVAGNTIADVVTGINSEWRYGGRGSSRNTLVGNRILAPAEAGLFIDVAGDHNRLSGNLVVRGGGPPIVLQGASDSVVTGNRACAGRAGPVVMLQSAHFGDGSPAYSLRNEVARNANVASCTRP